MWELNDNLVFHKHQVMGSTIYEVENVYKFPKKVKRWLFNRNVPLWKFGDPNSLNGKYFIDKRLITFNKDAMQLLELCSDLSKQKLDTNDLVTNQTKFIPNDYNKKYKTHYWWHHIDVGYNGIVYFNESDEDNGTNLYHPQTTLRKNHEHEDPWMSKEGIKLVHEIKPKFNKLVLFDGLYFPHGMAINDDRYFTQYRINQTIFMKAP